MTASARPLALGPLLETLFLTALSEQGLSCKPAIYRFETEIAVSLSPSGRRSASSVSAIPLVNIAHDRESDGIIAVGCCVNAL
jgi:hypothetical protein